MELQQKSLKTMEKGDKELTPLLGTFDPLGNKTKVKNRVDPND